MADPLASVVILNFNGKSFLNDCLKSVLSNRYTNYEVILVDNNSTDDSLELARKSFGNDPHLKIVESCTNLGFSGGNNIGFAYAKGDYIAFLNNDTVVDPDWLSTLVAAMKNDSNIGLAQSLILNMDGKTIQNAGWLLNSYLVNKYDLCSNKPSDTKLQPLYEISFPCGASMMVRRDLVEETGLFDPKLLFFYDDTLLGFKTWLAKKRVVTVSSSKVKHLSGATKVWNIKFTTYHLLKANICLLFDSYPTLSGLTKASLVTAFTLTTNSIFCALNKNVNAIIGNIQALTWAFKNFRYIWQNKLSHWNRTKVSPQTLEKSFIRIKLPLPFYLVPSKMGASCLAHEFQKYERQIVNL